MIDYRKQTAEKSGDIFQIDLPKEGYNTFKTIRLALPLAVSVFLGLGLTHPASSNVFSAAAVLSIFYALGLLACLINSILGLFTPERMTEQEYRWNHTYHLIINCILTLLFLATSICQFAYCVRTGERGDITVLLCYVLCTVVMAVSFLLNRKIKVNKVEEAGEQA